MDSVDTAKSYYDVLGKRLSSQVDLDQTQKELFFLSQFISSDDKVLDVGCGYGRIAKELLKKGVAVWGCDVSEEMIALASDDRFIVADMRSLPYEDNEFSVAICLWSGFNSLLSRQDQLAGLTELCRVSSRTVFIDLPDGDDIPHSWQRRRKGTGPGGHLVENYFEGPKNTIFVHTQESLSKLCDELGIAYVLSRESFGGRRRLLLTISV